MGVGKGRRQGTIYPSSHLNDAARETLSMKKTYAILGAGMQGTASAYDLAKFADPSKILMGDTNLDTAKHNAWRVNDRIGSAICEPAVVNALDPSSLAGFLEGVDVVLSCVPYWMHPKVAKTAIDTKTNMVDMGGDTEVTMETMKLNEQAKSAGISIVPDTGLAPGLVNNLATYMMEQMDSVDSIKLYCGGLPQNPKPPFNYRLVFNIEGLVTEYVDQAVAIRNDEIILIETLSELESLEFESLGTMEAFTTSGGTSTSPYTFHGKAHNYEYKTVRFPGHCERMRIFKDFGFWELDEIDVNGTKVQPREVFHKIMGESLKDPNDKDQVVVRGIGVGTKDGKPWRMQIDIHQKWCETTGLSAMEQLTGFSTAIYAADIANGLVEPGCIRYETALTGKRFVEQLQLRGIQLKFS